MKAPPFEYHRPSSLDEALGLLAELDEAKILAGGQSLLPLMSLRLGRPEHVVDIGDLGILDSLVVEPDGSVRVGALVTHRQVETSAEVAAHAPLLHAAAPMIGHRPIRTRGTVCGSIAHADPAAEMPAVALACNAAITAVSSRAAREIAAADFFEGYLQTVIEPDEIVTRVQFGPWPRHRRGAVVEQSRRSGDYAIIGLACWLDIEDNTITDAALSFFGVSDTPIRVAEAEDVLRGQAPTQSTFSAAGRTAAGVLRPTSDIHASANYRRHLAAVLTERGLAKATAESGETR
ncbi:MAG: xanthine dehydrogenase family protein subunit M [Actinomycetia bacterium]|nr:xanthine dehydrogenase family protein subunit M [Actinomycetes bacterium]